jgi:hypothetical protein
MLPLPEKNWSKPHVLASWLELCALARDYGAAYRGSALEMLRDSQLFADASSVRGSARDSTSPDSAAGTLEQAWRVLRSRERSLGAAWPLRLTADSLLRRQDRATLSRVAAYTTMLLIEACSLRWYDGLAIQPGDEVRELFEHIAVAAIRRYTDGQISRFGAPFSSDWPPTFPARVKHLASMFGVRANDEDIQKLSGPKQQDDSLDIVARLKFIDEASGLPYLLVQCATGEKWASDKPGQPTMTLWERYITWDGPRLKALAIPFALRDVGELENASVRHFNAVVFDRIRLAGALPDNFIEPALRKRLARWCAAKFAVFRRKKQARRRSERGRRLRWMARSVP